MTQDSDPAVPAVIEWAWAGSALEDESGDLEVVVAFPGGALVALIDGLGHGYEAAVAARAAADVLAEHPRDAVLDLMHRCHDALRRTRGAVMTIASLSAAEAMMTWLCVGNVEGVLLRRGAAPDAAVTMRGGVVGYQLPPLRAVDVSIAAGDTLIMATDGILGGFTSGLVLDRPPHEIAYSILDRFASGSDDARVVVARYLGESP